MNIKKIVIFLIMCVGIFIITQYIVKKNLIETFTDSQPAPYSKTCQKKLLEDATQYKYSINDLKNVYSLTDKNDNISLYYKNLSNDLGNVNIIKNITNPININKNDNSILLPEKKNVFKESKICKRGEVVVYKTNNNINIYKFHKINSNNIDIIPSEIIETDNSIEFSNLFFNTIFSNITTNSKNYIKIFDDLSQNMNKKFYEIFIKVETIILKKINSLKELKYNTIEEYNIFYIVKRYINSFLKDTKLNLYTINFDLLIHRPKKQHGKHINIIINYNDDTKILDIIKIRVIGIVVEYDLYTAERQLINIYDENEYTLSTMSDSEITKYLEAHKANTNINI